MSTNLFGIEQIDTYKMPVKHPGTGHPLAYQVKSEDGKKVLESHPFYIEHYGQQSDIAQDWVRNSVNASLKPSTTPKPDKDFDAIQAENVELLVAMVKGWHMRNLKTGEEIPFSPEKLTELLLDPEYNWLKVQIDASIKDASNFFQG